MSELFSILGLAKDKSKAFSFLEKPCYTLDLIELQKSGLSNCSSSWLSRYSNMNLSRLHPDKDSFWILTGKDKDIAKRLVSAKNRMLAAKGLDPAMNKSSLQYNAALNSKINEQVFDAIEKSPIYKFSADTVQEIEAIARKIDYNI